MRLKSDLETTRKYYYALAKGIEKLQNELKSLADSRHIVDDAHSHLCIPEGENNYCVIRKFESVIDKGSDFLILR